MDTRNQQFLEQWETQRQQGKGRFILKRGVFGFGLLIPFLLTASTLIQYGLQVDEFLASGELGEALINFVLYPFIGGPLFGWALWRYNEKRYVQLKNDEKR
ncbi:hypothetical protein N781_05395 [Pontibacillus halophilus JSM 076056 = DSM 19796]|uniref:Uncharacterized protein n=1 Tax=Pontibacillus halophilus JSM 076056 = DSM 19796 TaxID=1385510 RepID=A0A0A5GIY0_9BACI|nr:hypothetical protein [Pontibacillus halophilus]KGX91183.1 hypothetical protein N781_05395 [Pontibacillus halophilus JSM 076056 = DSM 19796]